MNTAIDPMTTPAPFMAQLPENAVATVIEIRTAAPIGQPEANSGSLGLGRSEFHSCGIRSTGGFSSMPKDSL